MSSLSLIALVRLVAALAVFSSAGVAGEGLGQRQFSLPLPGGGVSLTLESARAETLDNGRDVAFECKVVIQNDTGSDLEARSHFYSIYDGLELVVFGESGEILVRQSYLLHQSPFSAEGRPFPVARGANRGTLGFPILDLKPDIRKVRAQVVGVLPGCDRAGFLVSGLADVTITTPAMRGPLPYWVRSLEVEYREPATNRPVTFSAPPDRWDALLSAMMPVRRDENPASWETLGTLKVVEGGGDRALTIRLYSVGRGPGAFSIEGPGKERTYYRGGPSDALIKALRSAREARVTTNPVAPR